MFQKYWKKYFSAYTSTYVTEYFFADVNRSYETHYFIIPPFSKQRNILILDEHFLFIFI